MPLPPLLLERLKRRKIIQEAADHDDNCEPAITSTGSTKPSASSNQAYEEEPLAQRRLTTATTSEEAPEQEEEIIAEDYSEESEAGDEESAHATDSCNSNSHLDQENESNDNSHDHPSHTPGNRGARTSDTNNDDDHDDEHRLNCSPSFSSRTESVLGCPNKYNIYHDCTKYCEDNYSQPENLSPSMEQRKQLALVLRTYPMSNEWTAVYDPGVRTFYFWNIISNLVSWFPPGMNGFVSMSADQIRRSMRDNEEQPQEV